jgi:hypothetical protein
MVEVRSPLPVRSFARLVPLVGLVLLAGACRDYTATPLSEEVFGADEVYQADGLHADATVNDGARIRFAAADRPTLKVEPGQERQIGSLLNVPEAMRYGEYLWHEDGVPPGKPWILVDLKAQTMSVFRGKDEIGTAITLYGVDNKPTPTGRFVVRAKLKDHVSSLYDSPMPYTLRLTDDGIAIHGSDVRDGAGTHGCLGIPLEFAKQLFERVPVGTEVVILRDAAASVASPPQAKPGDLS